MMPFKSIQALIVSVVLTAPACSSSSSADDGETTSSTTSSSGSGESGEETGTDDPSECPMPYLSMDPNGEVPAPFANCTLPEPCGDVVFEMIGAGGTDGGDENQSPAELQCLLDALAQGDPGRYSIHAENFNTNIDIEIRVYADQHAEWSLDETDDSAFTQSRTPVHLDTAYFDANVCNATTTWEGVWSCVQGGLLACEVWADEGMLCGG